MKVWNWSMTLLAGAAGLAVGWEAGSWQYATVTNQIACFMLSLLVYITVLILALGTAGAVQVGLRMAGAAYPLAVAIPYFLAWHRAMEMWGANGLLLGFVSVVPVAGAVAALFALVGLVDRCPKCGHDALLLWRLNLCCPLCSEEPAGLVAKDTLNVFRG